MRDGLPKIKTAAGVDDRVVHGPAGGDCDGSIQVDDRILRRAAGNDHSSVVVDGRALRMSVVKEEEAAGIDDRAVRGPAEPVNDTIRVHGRVVRRAAGHDKRGGKGVHRLRFDQVFMGQQFPVAAVIHAGAWGGNRHARPFGDADRPGERRPGEIESRAAAGNAHSSFLSDDGAVHDAAGVNFNVRVVIDRDPGRRGAAMDRRG